MAIIVLALAGVGVYYCVKEGKRAMARRHGQQRPCGPRPVDRDATGYNHQQWCNRQCRGHCKDQTLIQPREVEPYQGHSPDFTGQQGNMAPQMTGLDEKAPAYEKAPAF